MNYQNRIVSRKAATISFIDSGAGRVRSAVLNGEKRLPCGFVLYCYRVRLQFNLV
jgi:hypothetical protein